MLTEENVRQFKNHGFTACHTFFDLEETAAMQGELLRLQRAGLLNNVATDGDGRTASRTRRNLQLCPMYPHSRLFRALPFDPRVTSAASMLIGDPVVLRLDQVFLKPAGDGSGTNWHQDNAYFTVSDPFSGAAMWIAVHEARATNGTIRVIPDCTRPLEHKRDPDSNHHIRCYPDESRAVTLELPAGGVAFFSYGTPHCTGANPTGSDRAGVAFHFCRAECMDEDGQVGGRRIPGYHPVLTGTDAAGGADAYGEIVAGTWRAQVQVALEEYRRAAAE
ncbi:MAG TPA: phytanoyl-CoA dioxygenase family protein [Chthonomonadales bacterium]|nr:phytanoyl-CoA dioxygenase family protein [Chthonomonadales bacterium]